MTSQASRSLDAAYGEYLASRSSSAAMQASPAVYPSVSRTPSVPSSCRKCADAIEHLEETGALASRSGASRGSSASPSSGASRGSGASPSIQAEKQQLENFIERSRTRSPSGRSPSRAISGRSPSSPGRSGASPSPAVMRQIDQIFAATEEPSSVRSAPVAATRYSPSRSASPTRSPVRARSLSSAVSRGSGVSPSPAVMEQVSQILSGSRTASPSRTAAVQDVDRILRSARSGALPTRSSARIVRQVTNPDTGAEGQVVRRADGELRYYIDGEMVTQDVFEAELGY